MCLGFIFIKVASAVPHAPLTVPGRRDQNHIYTSDLKESISIRTVSNGVSLGLWDGVLGGATPRLISDAKKQGI